MKLRSVLSAAATAGLLSLSSAPAHALLVLDSWQLDLTGAGIASTTTDIGHLVVAGLGATIQQEVNGSGSPFVGARFSEFGETFIISYVQDNVTGAGDFGTNKTLNNLSVLGTDGLRLSFSGLSGTVTSFNAGSGEITFAFDAGAGSIKLETTEAVPTLLAEFALVPPSNGSLNNINGATGTVGTASLLSMVLNTNYTSNLFRDSAGDSLNPYVTGALAPGLFLNLVTNNKITSPFTAAGACAFDVSALCIQGGVTSEGSVDLLRVPEPGSLALLGGALLGLYGFSRRRA